MSQNPFLFCVYSENPNVILLYIVSVPIYIPPSYFAVTRHVPQHFPTVICVRPLMFLSLLHLIGDSPWLVLSGCSWPLELSQSTAPILNAGRSAPKFSFRLSPAHFSRSSNPDGGSTVTCPRTRFSYPPHRCALIPLSKPKTHNFRLVIWCYFTRFSEQPMAFDGTYAVLSCLHSPFILVYYLYVPYNFWLSC